EGQIDALQDLVPWVAARYVASLKNGSCRHGERAPSIVGGVLRMLTRAPGRLAPAPPAGLAPAPGPRVATRAGCDGETPSRGDHSREGISPGAGRAARSPRRCARTRRRWGGTGRPTRPGTAERVHCG